MATGRPAPADKFYHPTPYNPADEQSVLKWADVLVQQKLGDKLLFWPIGKANGKGQFGNVLEEFYFYKKLDNISEPDFPCGIELKTAPLYKLQRGGILSVKERVSLSMINFRELPRERFSSSTFLNKNSKLLLVFYLWKSKQVPTDALIENVYLWEMPAEDLPVIEEDWKAIHR